jgi:hypothetical protein
MSNELLPASVIKTQLGLTPNSDVHRFFTQTCAIHMDKYVPYDTGVLSMYDLEVDRIVYNPVYAEYQYYGLSKRGKPLNYHKDKHPLATSYWDKHMWTAEGSIVEDEVQEYIRRRK